MRMIVKVLVVMTALSALAQVAERGASIAGTVVGVDGKPVAGVRVMVTPAAVKEGEANPGVFLAVSGADGVYTIAVLAEGEYNVCASDEQRRFVNPCTWSGPVAVKLEAGESRTGVQVRIEEAAEVVIEIRDAGQRLASVAHSIVVGISGPYMFVPATSGAREAAARAYKAYVPYEKDIEVSIVSETLALAEEGGRALKKGGDTVRLRVPRGQKQKTVVINVTGVVEGK